MELNPQTVVWEYTLACDSKCIHCGSDAKKSRSDELTTEESLDLVNQIADVGFNTIVLSGGEPTLRKDWVQTARQIKKDGLKFGMISNALAWTPKTIEELVSIGPFAVGFSVDGEPETHDYLRGVEGSHKKVFDTIKTLKRNNQIICAVTAVNNINLPELVKIRNRLIVYGVDAWQIQMASPMGRMKEHGDLVLNNDEYYQLGEFVADTMARLPHMNIQPGDCLGYYGKLGEKMGRSQWKGCGAGIEGLGVRSNGDIVGCLSIWEYPVVEGNIKHKSLKQIWNDPASFTYNRSFNPKDLKGDCSGCDYGAKCRGGCSSQSTAFFGEMHHAPYCFHLIESSKK